MGIYLGPMAFLAHAGRLPRQEVRNTLSTIMRATREVSNTPNSLVGALLPRNHSAPVTDIVAGTRHKASRWKEQESYGRHRHGYYTHEDTKKPSTDDSMRVHCSSADTRKSKGVCAVLILNAHVLFYLYARTPVSG